MRLPTIALALCAATFPLRAQETAEPLFERSVVFEMGPDRKPTYRIPALLQVPGGDLLAFAEKRINGSGDIGDIDLVMKRSSDRGRTWSDEVVILDDGDRTTADPAPGYDRETGRIWLFFLRDKKEFCCFTSDDGGASWEGPTSIHAQVTEPEWNELPVTEEQKPNPRSPSAKWRYGYAQRYGIGPGQAVVQLESGRLLVAARHRVDIGGGRMRSVAHCFLSEDHGATWRLGGNVGVNTNECQPVLLGGDTVLMNSRTSGHAFEPNDQRRQVSVSRDGGETWSRPARAEELITPVCHGSLTRYDAAHLLFANPACPVRFPDHPHGRYNVTVRVSRDEGRTWSAGRTVWPHPSGYSDIQTLTDGTIGLVYEQGDQGSEWYAQRIAYARFSFDWLQTSSY